VLRDPVAEFSGGVLSEDQAEVEPTRDRAVLGHQHVEGGEVGAVRQLEGQDRQGMADIQPLQLGRVRPPRIASDGASPHHIFAMKALAARTRDVDDLWLLADIAGITSLSSCRIATAFSVAVTRDTSYRSRG